MNRKVIVMIDTALLSRPLELYEDDVATMVSEAPGESIVLDDSHPGMADGGTRQEEYFGGNPNGTCGCGCGCDYSW